MDAEGSPLDALFNCSSEHGRRQQERFDDMPPYRLQIECTSACSGGCTYCYAKTVESGAELKINEIEAILDSAASLGIEQVDWMGGDPLERPDWEDLMKAARYRGLTNNLWTFGPKLNDVVTARKVMELTEDGFVMVHIDSLDPNVLKGLRTSYEAATHQEAFRGIRLLQDMGKPREDMGNLIMMTSQHTLDDVKATMSALYRDLGLRSCLMSLKPVDGKGRLYGLLPRADMVNQAYSARDALFMDGGRMGCQDVPKQFCGTTVFVSLDGQVSSCNQLRKPLGSVRASSLEDIVETNADQLFFTEYRRDHGEMACPVCDHGACWGCRANAFYFGRGAYEPDPLCGSSAADGGGCPH